MIKEIVKHCQELSNKSICDHNGTEEGNSELIKIKHLPFTVGSPSLKRSSWWEKTTGNILKVYIWLILTLKTQGLVCTHDWFTDECLNREPSTMIQPSLRLNTELNLVLVSLFLTELDGQQAFRLGNGVV